MKKKLIIGIAILVLGFAVFTIANQQGFNLLTKKEPVSETYNNYTLLYVLNEQQQLVGIKVGTNAQIEDEINYKWNLLTYNYHQLPKGFKSPIYVSTMLIDYQVENKTLTLNMSDDFLYSEDRKVLECLAYNYCNDDIEQLCLKIDGEKIREFASLTFDYINKDIGCNLTFETTDLFNTDDLTMVYHYEDYLLPVTYYYDVTQPNFDKLTYLVHKAMLVDQYASTIDYTSLVSYEIEASILTVTINNDINVTTSIIETLKDSIMINYDFEEIILNGISI